MYRQSFPADAGYQYVLLYNVETSNWEDAPPLRMVGVPVANGGYLYSFNQVPEGRYVITAGSDLNNNDLLSDSSDAKGDYPYSGASAEIVVGGDSIRGLDFTSGYNLLFTTGLAAEFPRNKTPAGVQKP